MIQAHAACLAEMTVLQRAMPTIKFYVFHSIGGLYADAPIAFLPSFVVELPGIWYVESVRQY